MIVRAQAVQVHHGSVAAQRLQAAGQRRLGRFRQVLEGHHVHRLVVPLDETAKLLGRGEQRPGHNEIVVVVQVLGHDVAVVGRLRLDPHQQHDGQTGLAGKRGERRQQFLHRHETALDAALFGLFLADLQQHVVFLRTRRAQGEGVAAKRSASGSTAGAGPVAEVGPVCRTGPSSECGVPLPACPTLPTPAVPPEVPPGRRDLP